MFIISLFLTLLFVLSVAGTPVLISRSTVSLPISRKINSTGINNILKHDISRAQTLRTHGSSSKLSSAAKIVSSKIEDQTVFFSATIGVGNPPTNYELIVDTGSSNTWIGAGKAFKPTSTTTKTKDAVSVTYGSGSFSGTEFIDRVTLGAGLVIPKQSIGVASTSSGFSGIDGILGLGPTDLTLGTLSPDTKTLIPTVVDSLFAGRVIPANEISISLEPTTSNNVLNGEITWGGTDSKQFTGSIHFTPITKTSPSSQFWGINQSIKYGSTNILSSTAGIVDSGTTLILIATNAFNVYKKVTGAVLDRNTGLLRITPAQFAKLQSLTFTTNGASFALTANAQIFPRSLNSAIGGSASQIFLIVNDIGSNSGSGLDFINGQTFLQRFYSVYDTANRRVGFATTPFTNAKTN